MVEISVKRQENLTRKMTGWYWDASRVQPAEGTTLGVIPCWKMVKCSRNKLFWPGPATPLISPKLRVAYSWRYGWHVTALCLKIRNAIVDQINGFLRLVLMVRQNQNQFDIIWHPHVNNNHCKQKKRNMSNSKKRARSVVSFTPPSQWFQCWYTHGFAMRCIGIDSA